MPITIDEAPDIEACSQCARLLTWIYVHHLKRTVAVVPVDGVDDRNQFRLHTCSSRPVEGIDRVRRPWRYPRAHSQEVFERGSRRARAAVDEIARKRAQRQQRQVTGG